MFAAHPCDNFSLVANGLMHRQLKFLGPTAHNWIHFSGDDELDQPQRAQSRDAESIKPGATNVLHSIGIDQDVIISEYTVKVVENDPNVSEVRL
jgi:hypothetical protein